MPLLGGAASGRRSLRRGRGSGGRALLASASGFSSSSASRVEPAVRRSKGGAGGTTGGGWVPGARGDGACARSISAPGLAIVPESRPRLGIGHGIGRRRRLLSRRRRADAATGVDGERTGEKPAPAESPWRPARRDRVSIAPAGVDIRGVELDVACRLRHGAERGSGRARGSARGMARAVARTARARPRRLGRRGTRYHRPRMRRPAAHRRLPEPASGRGRRP